MLPSIHRVITSVITAAAATGVAVLGFVGCAGPPEAATVPAATAAGPASAAEAAAAAVAQERIDNDKYWNYLCASYDADHDGKVGRPEYRRSVEGFERLDRDHDGTLTRADLDLPVKAPPDLVLPFHFVRLFGEKNADSVACEQVVAGFVRLDTSGDGQVNRAEFEAIPAQGSGVGMDRYAILLAGTDRDGDEQVSIPEIEAWCRARDTDGDGRLARRERMEPGPAPVTGWIEPAERVMAPDFTATSLADGGPWTVSALAGKRPIVLIFGSFT